MATTNGNGNGGNGTTAKKATKKAAAKITPEKAIRVRREALGLSRAKLADEAEVPVSQVWRAEHEEAGVDPETRERIVEVLNTHRDEIAKLPRL